jgi:Uma2 family endonuclease
METAAVLSDYEAERGKPTPSKNHAAAQSNLGVALARYAEQFNVFSELTIQLGETEFVPDLCLFPQQEIDWEADAVRVTDTPLLVIEILSPRQALTDLQAKAEAYFAAGIPACWIVLPSFQTIMVLSPDQKPQYFTEGTIQDPGTNIEVAVEDIFR